ncbi:MAG: hypothetical protein ACYC6T_14490 [Thermoleophilia bacterium]
MRSLNVHLSGGTEITVETDVEPSVVFDALTGEGDWLVVEDLLGERHYLAVHCIAYLSFGRRKGIGFA